MYGNETYLPHTLRTLEYDTILADEVTDFKMYIKKVPTDLHVIVFKAWTHSITSRDREQFNSYLQWIKSNSSLHMPSRVYHERIDPSEGRAFFRLLREHDTSKWKRAVKTLARNVRLGVMNVHIKVAGRETTKMVQVAQNGLVDVQDQLEEVRDTIERKEDAGVDTSRDQRLLTKLLHDEKEAQSILKLMLEAQAVYRSKYGSKRHYKLDTSDAARKTKRDPKQELAEAQEYGWYSWRELRLVPLSEIEPQKVWKPSRIEKIREGLASNVALPAVKLARQDGRYKYAITDGIHRYNASLEAGFSHIPAIVTVTEDVPHMKTEKKVFYAGQFVTFKDKLNGRWEYGYLVENLYNDVFVTMVADDTEADWAGDLGSHYFDRVVSPPRHIKDLIMGHWFLNRKSSDRTAKNVPKKVKEYVKKFEDEGKDESFAWSLAWSIYCEHKNPGSPSCKQESYLEGQKTSSIAVRVAARYFKPENPS